MGRGREGGGPAGQRLEAHWGEESTCGRWSDRPQGEEDAGLSFRSCLSRGAGCSGALCVLELGAYASSPRTWVQLQTGSQQLSVLSWGRGRDWLREVLLQAASGPSWGSPGLSSSSADRLLAGQSDQAARLCWWEGGPGRLVCACRSCAHVAYPGVCMQACALGYSLAHVCLCVCQEGPQVERVLDASCPPGAACLSTPTGP